MSTKLDKVDIAILNILQKESNITTKALADKLNLTTTPVFERVKRMEKQGVIERYVALLNPAKVNKTLTVFISISIKNHTRSYLEKFMNEVNEFEEVMECFHIAGNFDFLLKVITRDMDSYQKFLLSKLSTNANIAHVQSSFALSASKQKTALPLHDMA